MKPVGLKEIEERNLGDYAKKYLNRIEEISNHIKQNDGIKTHVNLHSVIDSDDVLRASLVLSDLTTLSIGGGDAKFIISHATRKFQIPIDLAKEHNLSPESKEVSFGVFQCDDDYSKNLCKDILPFFKQNSLILRPEALIIFKKAEKQWHCLPVVTAGNDDIWIVKKSKQLDGEFPITLNTNSSIPFDLVIPYLKGLSWSDFHGILCDSTDTIVSLRKSLKKAIINIKNFDEKILQEIRMDTIEPELATLERQFKKATTIHGLKMAGASVGAIALSLSAIVSSGSMATVSGLLGAGGLGLLTKEYADYKGKLLELKDNPYYLFWRAAQRNR